VGAVARTEPRTRRAAPGGRYPPYLRWVGLCAAAEAVGMTAAAAASTTANHAIENPSSAPGVAAALGLAVAGGLVEGTALGYAQARGLAGLLPAPARRRWLGATVVVAGLGWAAGSLPAVLADGQGDGSEPPRVLVLAGAAGLGAVMGAALGAAQAWALRGHVARPWRWVGASAVAWTPAMVVVFGGASTPDADWPPGAVVGLGTLTGVAAGAVLGLVSGLFLPALDGEAGRWRPRRPPRRPPMAAHR
jgi:hypothetical protein